MLEIAEDFGRLKTDFPDYFKGLKLDFGIVERMNKDSYAAYDPQTGIIHLNPNYYNNFSKLIQSYTSDVGKNNHPAGTNYRANVFHEFGHRFEHITGYSPKKIAKESFERLNDRYYTRKLCDLWVSSGLSLYSKYYDYEEIIAESFAEYYCSQQPRKVCTDIVRQFLK